MIREQVSLNGLWDWYILEGKKKKIKVPSSYLCVGETTFERTFQINLLRNRRVILRFEGIAYEGIVYVNENYIGNMLPYSRYDFDITEYINQGENKIRVNIKDINASYGPSDGWENYGGIIWDVYLDIRNNVYISDYLILTDFTDNYKKARCLLKVWHHSFIDEIFKGTLSAILTYSGIEVARVSKDVEVNPGEGCFELEFDILNPLLWSPEFPHLYDLEIELRDDAGILDRINQKIGFREFTKKGTRFYLNGQDIILKGVCRHHMWGEQGYTLSLEQIEKDMQMIKNMGANYVRLVHYPHPKQVIEIADRLGLMVSEEPGLWWSDLNDPTIANSALEVLRRTILRDRNNPSVIFWLIFNECIFAGDYIKRAKNLCKELDPSRMVSAANCMNPEWTKEVFTKEGLDFYTFHPYGYTPGDPYGYDRIPVVQRGYGSEKPFTSLEEILEILNDKPVVFTEWGGGRAFENPTIVKNFWRAMSNLFFRDSSNLTGTSYWCWNDYFEFSRWLPGDIKGISATGLVDIYRNKRVNYYVLLDLFSQTNYLSKEKPGLEFPISSFCMDTLNLEPLELDTLINLKEQESAWNLALERIDLENKRRRRKEKTIGPIIPEEVKYIGNIPVRILLGRPLVLSSEIKRINVGIKKKVKKLFVFGHTTLPTGYPVKGKLGEEIAQYTLIYEDGEEKKVILRNGIEFTTSNLIWSSSRINPIGSKLKQALKIIIDPIYEIYVVNLFSIDTDESKILESLVCELINPYFIPLFYGITLGTVI